MCSTIITFSLYLNSSKRYDKYDRYDTANVYAVKNAVIPFVTPLRSCRCDGLNDFKSINRRTLAILLFPPILYHGDWRLEPVEIHAE
jgi:hypothetical protein